MGSKVFVGFAFILPFVLLSQAFFLTKEKVDKRPYFKKTLNSSPELHFDVKRSDSTIENTSDDYFDDDYYTYRFGISENGEQGEDLCSEDMYWHARSFKCVPYDCPGGNQFRDKHTGDCLLKFYGYQNNQRDDLDDRQLRIHNSRVRSSSPTKLRLPFGLSIKAG